MKPKAYTDLYDTYLLVGGMVLLQPQAMYCPQAKPGGADYR